MPRTRRPRALAIAATWLATAPSSAPAQAPAASPPSIARAEARSRPLAPPRVRPDSTASDPGGGWWLGTAGIAAALAAFGGVSLASKRFLPSRDSGPIRVVGRSALSPKHSACLLRVGDRVLIVGLGPQGAPSTLGEVTDPAELARLAPRREHRPDPSPIVEGRSGPLRGSTLGPRAGDHPGRVAVRPSAGFDRRIGDDE